MNREAIKLAGDDSGGQRPGHATVARLQEANAGDEVSVVSALSRSEVDDAGRGGSEYQRSDGKVAQIVGHGRPGAPAVGRFPYSTVRRADVKRPGDRRVWRDRGHSSRAVGGTERDPVAADNPLRPDPPLRRLRAAERVIGGDRLQATLGIDPPAVAMPLEVEADPLADGVGPVAHALLGVRRVRRLFLSGRRRGPGQEEKADGEANRLDSHPSLISGKSRAWYTKASSKEVQTEFRGCSRMLRDSSGLFRTLRKSLMRKGPQKSRRDASSCQGGCRGLDPRFPLHAVASPAPLGFRPAGSSAPGLRSRGERLLLAFARRLLSPRWAGASRRRR